MSAIILRTISLGGVLFQRGADVSSIATPGEIESLRSAGVLHVDEATPDVDDTDELDELDQSDDDELDQSDDDELDHADEDPADDEDLVDDDELDHADEDPADDEDLVDDDELDQPDDADLDESADKDLIDEDTADDEDLFADDEDAPVAMFGLAPEIVELLAANDPPIVTEDDVMNYAAKHNDNFAAITGIGRSRSRVIVAAVKASLA